MPNLTRRSFVIKMATIPLVAVCTPTAPVTSSAQPAQKLTVNVATLTDINSVFASATVYRLKQNGLFESTAKSAGYDLTVNWKQFPFAPDMISDAAGGGVQLGTIATFPILTQIAKKQPVYPLHVSFGSWEFMMVVSKDGPIKNFEDLKGKTIGLARGTTLEEFLQNFLLMEFGSTPTQLGIKVVQQPIPVATMPPGIDAIVTYIPAWSALQDKGKQEVLISSLGVTGPAYDGPLGKGADKAVPSVKKSPFAPEGFVSLRHFFCVFGDFGQKNPEVIKAWLVAYQKTVRELKAMSPSQISELFPADLWKTMPRQAFEDLSIKRDLMYQHRDWIWPTEGELNIMEAETKMMVSMGLLEKPLSRAEIVENFKPNFAALKTAYEQGGSYPGKDVFTKQDTKDVRGQALWDVSV